MKLTILVVDDDPHITRLRRRQFVRHGHNVLTADHGEEGLLVLKNNLKDIDVIVSDVNMPNMSGIQMARHVRALRYRGLVILVSGKHLQDQYDDDRATYELLRLEPPVIYAYVLKPVEQQVLLGLVEDAALQSKDHDVQERIQASIDAETETSSETKGND